MTCLKPIRIVKNLPVMDYPDGLMVPCGKCDACREQKAREWCLRLEHEMMYWEDALFLTLTYDNENCPKNYSLNKRELQLFWKRLRKGWQDEGIKIKYYACGEYGERYGRPHYHAILFLNINLMKCNGMDKMDEIERAWGSGHVEFGSVTAQSIRYVCGYMNEMKGHEGYRERAFRVMSQGFGEKYLDEKFDELYEDKKINVRGKPVALPRYYKKKLDLDPKEMMKLSESRELEFVKEYMKKNKIKVLDKRAWKVIYQKMGKQKAWNMQGRNKIYEKSHRNF